MEYDKDFLKQQLSLQGINASDEDVKYVQRVLDIINTGAKQLDDFSDIEDQSIVLTMDLMDMEESNND